MRIVSITVFIKKNNRLNRVVKKVTVCTFMLPLGCSITVDFELLNDAVRRLEGQA